ncbi:MAG: His-Xaa-Ser system protein HxsD [Bacteroides sp.]|nr:His-Xaa-Ser system protein HxsD [Bacteroides sp.]
MTLIIDKRVYNDSVISKVVYWMSGDYKIVRTSLDEFSEQIELIATNAESSESLVEEKFFQLLNDFKLRQIVADETRDIKTILYAKAFAEDEELSEEDIHD